MALQRYELGPTRASAREGQRWGICAFLLALVLFVWSYDESPLAQLAGADGYYTYVYTRSLVYDGDFDFANDYRICGDPNTKNVDRGGGHPSNPFNVGPTIFWAPAMWVAKHVVHLPPNAPPEVISACKGPIARWTLFMGPLLAALTIFVSYRLARRVASDLPAALAAALIGFGMPLTGYAMTWPHYVHVYDAFANALLLLFSVRASERPERIGRWVLVSLLIGVAFLQRPVSGAFALVPLVLACTLLWKRWRRLVLTLSVLCAGTLVFGLMPQMMLYKFLYGRYWLGGSPDGRYLLQLGHSHPWLALFGVKGGLFHWSPVAWLAVLGIVPGLRGKRTRVMVVSGLIAATLLIYVSSAVLDWAGSSAFGARRLTTLVAFGTYLAAIFLVRLEAWMRAKSERPLLLLGASVLTPVIFIELGAALGTADGMTTIERTMLQEELYAEGPRAIWRILDHTTGSLAVLPASAVFSWRYHLPLHAYPDVLEPWYERDHHTMAKPSGLPGFADKRWTNHFVHLAPTPDGAKMTAQRASFVFTAAWPFAQDLIVRARSKRPAAVEFASGRWWWRNLHEGTIELPGDETIVTQTLSLPAGAFDSGLNEQVISSLQAPDAGVEILSIEFVDKKEYPNPTSF